MGVLVGDENQVVDSVDSHIGWTRQVLRDHRVGPMTIAMLLDNTVESAKRMAGMK
ncbi:MAG: hypothetical protein E8D43_10780 [Nitrospira sp.]|nr:MAG: hypothetical protein E8D43_10780 [Nitrospira sp.]